MLPKVSVGRGTARAYEFDHHCQLRNHQDHLNNAQEALDSSSVFLSNLKLYVHILNMYFRLWMVLKDTHRYTFYLHLM